MNQNRKSTTATLAVMLWMIGMGVTGVQTAVAWGANSPGNVTVTETVRKASAAVRTDCDLE